MSILFYARVFLSLAVPCGLGYLILGKVIKARPSILLAAATAYPLGISAITFCLLLLGWTHASFFYVFILIGLAGGYGAITAERRDLHSKKIFSRLTPWESFLLALICLFILYAFWQASYYPIYAYDALAVEAFKAKVFFYDQDLNKLPGIIHSSFPLQIPLIMTWANLCITRWSDRVPQMQFPLLFISLIGLHLYILRHLAGRTWALIGGLALCASPLVMTHAAIPYRDLWMLYINSAALGFLIIWMKHDKAPAPLLLAFIFAGIGTYVKLEGLAYLLVFIGALQYISRNTTTPFTPRNVVNALTALILTAAPFMLFKLSRGIPFNEKAVIDLSMSKLSLIPVALQKFVHEMFLSGNWNVIWAICAAVSIMEWKKVMQLREIKILAGALGLYLSVHLLTVLLTNNAHDLLHPDTLSRIFIHFYFIPLWISVALLKDKRFIA